jgi:hypothetical protein
MAALVGSQLPKTEQTAIFEEVMDNVISAFVINSDLKNGILAEKGIPPKEFQYCCDPNMKATIQHLTQQLLEHNCINKLFGNIEGISDILSYRNLYIVLIVFYYAVGEISGYHNFDVKPILENIIVGENAEAVRSRTIVNKLIKLLSTLDKTNVGYDSECFQLLLTIRTELMKSRELSEEELRQWESGEADSDFSSKKGLSMARQDAIAQGWIARGRRRAHGGKKTKEKSYENQENIKIETPCLQ